MAERLRWVSSGYCSDTDATCVEVAITAPRVQVRDSWRVSGDSGEDAPRLTFSAAAWSLFIAHTTAD
ncbi:DUF397 domain-containing protein [Streptomyces ochraceiscleroticus]|uniref:DUF397 domain-containing protein n=1 Tax=Streptomyces ochraceiscleroticus TaxID=47761 RepID=A0ABW1MML5_9ACTN|nr:DUF397 domain-containing protein [Streptomyces ochraceiscleroticus]